MFVRMYLFRLHLRAVERGRIGEDLNSYVRLSSCSEVRGLKVFEGAAKLCGEGVRFLRPTALAGETPVVASGAQGAEEGAMIVGSGSGRVAMRVGGMAVGENVGGSWKNVQWLVLALHVPGIGQIADTGTPNALRQCCALGDKVEDIGLAALQRLDADNNAGALGNIRAPAEKVADLVFRLLAWKAIGNVRAPALQTMACPQLRRRVQRSVT